MLAALKAMPAKPSITKAVMYYPVCRGAGRWSGTTPALMPLGAADDVASPALCTAVAKGAPPESLRVITYPNARHGFDHRFVANDKGAAHGARDVAPGERWAFVEHRSMAEVIAAEGGR